jgi:hypothetical protein
MFCEALVILTRLDTLLSLCCIQLNTFALQNGEEVLDHDRHNLQN